MWFQRAEADLKCLAHKGGDDVQVVVEEALEYLSCGATTRLTVEFTKPASAADVIKPVVLWLVTDGTKYAVIGHPLYRSLK